MLLGPLVVVGGLLGTFVFHHDQRRRSSVPGGTRCVARRLWWTRQAFWFALLLVLRPRRVLADYVCRRVWQARVTSGTEGDIGAILGMTLLCYSVGQLLSLVDPQRVVRLTMTVLIGIRLGCWARLDGGAVAVP